MSLRFVLVRTSHPGNIGSAARAIRTMGFDQLQLVRPARFPDPEATALAVGASNVLERAGVHTELVDALSGCHRVFGLSARRRGITLPELSPREAAGDVHAALARGESVAMMFGNESSGLDNQELSHCHAMVRIPSVADFSSLNLAQAVQVMAYELRMAALGAGDDAAAQAAPAEPDDALADAAQMEQFYTHLREMLDAVEFHKGRSSETIMLKLRRLFQRARPDQHELRILHGILADAMRASRDTQK